jgi:quercetin dioxygenase-like cupin family protein
MSSHTSVVPAGAGRALNVLGDTITCKLLGAQTAGAWSLFEIATQNGPPPHKHPWEEAYYIVEGEVEFHIEGQSTKVGRGSFVDVGPNVVHTYQVKSPSARLLVWASPAGLEHFFEDLAREITEMPPDFAKVLAIAAKHRVEAVLPTGAA